MTQSEVEFLIVAARHPEHAKWLTDAGKAKGLELATVKERLLKEKQPWESLIWVERTEEMLEDAPYGTEEPTDA